MKASACFRSLIETGAFQFCGATFASPWQPISHSSEVFLSFVGLILIEKWGNCIA